MRHLRLTVAYRGTAYHGFQVQQNAVSVAKVFQDAVQAVFGTRYDIKGCSRTDSGVHARGFVLTLRVTESIPCAGVVQALNQQLPDDIAVLDCTEVADDFHPRYNARGKRYSYRIWNAPCRNPFECDTALHLPRRLDDRLMHQAAQALVGRHDFSAFCASRGSVGDKVRTVTRCEVTRDGELVTIQIEGDGFLYNMVRIIAGTLLEISYGKLPADAIPDILQSGDRARAGATAPPQGLCLEQVYY